MGGERKVSKGGGYVGGFLQLFDWNAKSRKKLFSSKSDLPEKSKQKKRSDINLPITRFDMMDEDELLGYSSMKGSSDYSCASSVTDEEGYGARAPGVVARLMGLDSLPTSNFTESFSTPFLDSHSLRESHYYKRNLDLNHDHQTMHSGNLRMKVEIPGPKVLELKPQKLINRPIEKFQTEVLPPKSAKSVPITHHKLLSPIKSPGFIPSKNAAHIMEAAAKIIEPGPHATVKAKKTLLGTSSVPLKVRDLKEKVEAAQKLSKQAQASSRRLVESNAAKLINGQSMNKSWNGSADTTSFRVSPDSEDCSGLKSKGKSISLAVQAKVNVQRREGLSPGGSSGGRSYFGHKELVDGISSQPLKSQPSSPKVMKKPSNSASNVLRQNNQKQNSVGGKEKLSVKSLPSQGRKVLSMDSSGGRQKNLSKFEGNSKVNSRKLGSEAPDSKREASHSTTNNIPRKKRSIDGNFHPNKNRVDSMLVDEIDKPTCGEDCKRKGIDIVSFTFTTPIARPSPSGEISMKTEKNNSFCGEYRGKRVALDSDSINITKLSSLGQNMIGADALSVLLEQKLRELTGVVESSSFRSGMVGNSASIFQDLSTCKALSTKLQSDDKKSQNGMHMDELGAHSSSNFSSTGSVELMMKPKLQVTEEMDECSSNDIDGRKLLHRQHPSPMSVLDPSLLTESCYSVDSADSYSTECSKPCSSVQAQEVFGMTSSRQFHPMEVDTEFSDSASSSSTRLTTRRKTFSSGGSTNWELEYVKEILFNVEFMFMEFALGRACEIINPRLFDQLETNKMVFQGEETRTSRKVIFDCVSECVELRCRTFAEGMSTLRRKERLAEEVYREISGWKGMGDCMVDDLVDKDMSSQYGKWLDFEVEAFELGTEIEDQILDSLVHELITDMALP